MIGGDNEKSYDECGKREIAALVPAEFVQRDTAAEGRNKHCEAAASEGRTGLLPALKQAHGPLQQTFELRGSDGTGHRSFDLTGWGSSRQLPGDVMSGDWIEVSFRSDVDAAELLSLLDDLFVQGSWQDEGTIHLYWPSHHWSPDHCVRLRHVLQQMDAREQAGPDILVQSLPHQDWNQQWAQSVKPLRVGRRLVIRPSWEPVVLQPNEIEIILDPKQAFGTGHHATTRMLLEWLQDHIRGGEVVLDVGAGSGILAMAALRLGAASAIGVECDPVAVDCARDYAAQNGFGGELELVCGTLNDMDKEIKPDLVLANLDQLTLLALADDLAAYGTAGARLLFSGVLVDQIAEVVALYCARGFYLVHRREQDGWVALELTRPESCEGHE
jgi:ribosomal protein L11 methyltransferase